jgi:hypothetical protein
MKIHEIIEPADLFGVIQNPLIIEIDQLYDEARALSANFAVPSGMMNHELRDELSSSIRDLVHQITGESNEWSQKLQQVMEWIDRN